MEQENVQVRYSDADLAEFKELILKKIEKAQADLELIKSAYMNDLNNGTDDTSPTFKAFEEGSETLSKEANSQLAIRMEKFIRDLKNALIRIENKTYGLCRVTGKLIEKERLKLVPHATLSMEAKLQRKYTLTKSRIYIRLFLRPQTNLRVAPTLFFYNQKTIRKLRRLFIWHIFSVEN